RTWRQVSQLADSYRQVGKLASTRFRISTCRVRSSEFNREPPVGSIRGVEHHVKDQAEKFGPRPAGRGTVDRGCKLVERTGADRSQWRDVRSTAQADSAATGRVALDGDSLADRRSRGPQEGRRRGE